MPPDPVVFENTREWLVRAKEDLAAAGFLLTSAEPLVRSALFHCQQAVEKAMKAFLTWRDEPFRKTHNLVELGDCCAELEPSLAKAAAEVAVLTKHSTRFRYPGAPYVPDLREAQVALRVARIFLKDLLAHFPPELVSEAGLGDVGHP